MLKNSDVIGEEMKCAENQPEYNLQEKQADKKYQQNLTHIALDVIQKLQDPLGSHKWLQELIKTCPATTGQV
jgi:hypothetical protein